MGYSQDNLIKLALQGKASQDNALMNQSGGRFQNLLGMMAKVASQNANPNSRMGDILGGAGNTYLANLQAINQGNFLKEIQAIHTSPGDPQTKLQSIMGTLSKYGQDPSNYKDVLDIYSKQIQAQIDNQLAPRFDNKGNLIGMFPPNASFAPNNEEKPPTQAMETTALYASRIKQANDVFNSLDGYLNKLPVVGTAINQAVPNFMKSSDYQSYDQAQRNFLTAVLRRESGAVISDKEMESGRKQYFPIPGDSPRVIAQKKANRDLVMKNFIKASGKAYVPYQETETVNQASGNDDPLGIL